MNYSTLCKAIAVEIISICLFTGCSEGTGRAEVPAKQIDSLKNEILRLTAAKDSIASYLVKFDTLDFTVFSNQEWSRLHESHAADVKVHWPDGHEADGIERHISELKVLFVYAPNTQIKVHPIRFGSGNITGVTGVMTGTFTKPMSIGNGKFIQPTNRSFSLPMCTIGIWKNGTMSEEYLYWDNKTYLTQMGLEK